MVKVGTRCNSGYREASFLKHFRQGMALCLALLLSFALSGTSHAQQRGVKQTQHIEESVTGRYLALLIGNNDELLPVVRPSLIFSGDPESLSGKKSHFYCTPTQQLAPEMSWCHDPQSVILGLNRLLHTSSRVMTSVK